MNIVFVDTCAAGEVDLSGIAALGNLTCYDRTEPDQVVERCAEADVVITNKVAFFEQEIAQLPNLKLICIAATGMNNVDLAYAAERGVAVKNVANYSTESVAQTTFALTLGLLQSSRYYDNYVKSGKYAQSRVFTHHGRPYFELKGKRWGIIGLGNIGRRVAEIASVFGAEVSYYSTSGKNSTNDYPQKSLKNLLLESDIISIHSPLNDQTKNLLNYDRLCLMKASALLINVGRGGIVVESDLAQALRENRLVGAGLDVFEQEPIQPDNPLLAPDIADKLLLAPHIAWASKESRQRLIDKICGNIEEFYGNIYGT
ncbi:MAG: D-2-hydroxyacid dehydrogenase [Bacteroidales bacterium]